MSEFRKFLLRRLDRHTAWLSETFDWDAIQTGEFLREIADEAWLAGYREGYESPDMPSDWQPTSPYHPDSNEVNEA